jgi:hypothetical protein
VIAVAGWSVFRAEKPMAGIYAVPSARNRPRRSVRTRKDFRSLRGGSRTVQPSAEHRTATTKESQAQLGHEGSSVFISDMSSRPR